jgi:hypothetical protein
VDNYCVENQVLASSRTYVGKEEFHILLAEVYQIRFHFFEEKWPTGNIYGNLIDR